MPNILPAAQRKCPPSQVKAAASVLCTLAKSMTAGAFIISGTCGRGAEYAHENAHRHKVGTLSTEGGFEKPDRVSDGGRLYCKRCRVGRNEL